MRRRPFGYYGVGIVHASAGVEYHCKILCFNQSVLTMLVLVSIVSSFKWSVTFILNVSPLKARKIIENLYTQNDLTF